MTRKDLFRLVVGRMFLICVAQLICAATANSVAQADPPEKLDPNLEILQNGVRLTIVAEHPDVVTPLTPEVSIRPCTGSNLGATLCPTFHRC